LLTLERVSKRFGPVGAVESIDLACAPGRTTVLLGASGSGKSTLLRLALGLIAPDAGEVRLGDTRVDVASAPALRRRMGYVIQDGGLFPHLTAADNAALAARHGPGASAWPRDRVAERLAELTRLARLPESAVARFPAQLSGGQRQRVALMRALFLDPELLLLDEPLGALDPLIRADLQSDLRDAFRELGKTVVMVTHDLAEAAFFADHVVLLRDGRIVQAGSFETLLDAPADEYVARFVRAQRGPVWERGAR
jgi:osmoprotectant transport system ATP-binding protein